MACFQHKLNIDLYFVIEIANNRPLNQWTCENCRCQTGKNV